MSKPFKYNCEKCDYHINAKSLYDKHLLTGKHLTGARMIRCDKQLIEKCEICGYVPANVNYMKLHALNAHSTIEDRKKSFPYYCEICDYGTFFEKVHDQHLISRNHKNVVKYAANANAIANAMIQKHITESLSQELKNQELSQLEPAIPLESPKPAIPLESPKPAIPLESPEPSITLESPEPVIPLESPEQVIPLESPAIPDQPESINI